MFILVTSFLLPLQRKLAILADAANYDALCSCSGSVISTTLGAASEPSDLQRMHIPLKKVMPFALLPKHQPGKTLDAANLPAQQMRLARPALLQHALF